MLFRVGYPSRGSVDLQVEGSCRIGGVHVRICAMGTMVPQDAQIVGVIRMQRIATYGIGRRFADNPQAVAISTV